ASHRGCCGCRSGSNTPTTCGPTCRRRWTPPWTRPRRRDQPDSGVAVALLPRRRRLERPLDRLGHPARDALLECLRGTLDAGVEVVAAFQRLERRGGPGAERRGLPAPAGAPARGA